MRSFRGHEAGPIHVHRRRLTPGSRATKERRNETHSSSFLWNPAHAISNDRSKISGACLAPHGRSARTIHQGSLQLRHANRSRTICVDGREPLP